MYYSFHRNENNKRNSEVRSQKTEGRIQKTRFKTYKVEIKSIVPLLSILYALCSLLFALCPGCAPRSTSKAYDKSYEVFGEQYYPINESKGFVEIGIASWYGKDFHGKKTSNGEIYDMNLKTAAHKILPLGTYVKVTNLENDKTCVVRINDRGPFAKGRIIDLSYATACELEMHLAGTAKVKIEALESNDINILSTNDFTIGNFTIQVGAFKNKENAVQLVDHLQRMYKSTRFAVFSSDADVFYRVRVGNFHHLDKAHDAQKELVERGYEESMVVAE